MKRFIAFLVALLVVLPLSPATAADRVVRITSFAHQTFSGEFRNDDLAQELTPSGRLGTLVFTPKVSNTTWVIDAALVDEVIAMTGDYKLASKAETIGNEIAASWLKQLRQITYGQQVVALAYGNPDVSLAKRLAPSELKNYYAYGKTQLQLALGRTVRSEPSGGWSTGKSRLSNELRKGYSDNRKALTRLSKVVNDPQLIATRAQLSKLLSPQLDKDSREYFSYSARAAVDSLVHKLRINSGKYQITTSSVKLPVTVINDFESDVTVDIAMLPINSRVIVDSFQAVTIPAQSKKQLEMQVEVVAPGQTAVGVYITDSKGNDVVPEATLTLNSTVIDSRVTWFTTGAAILLLLAAVAQSVRRVRKRSK
ncbi:hypothetical protein MCEMRE191_01452 [Candidatus Nanopelagicaceae bacterium]